ncbi:MAG TPA: ATP-binding protein [Saprospiraceae bacterium]|nr:ATP-binding protein [Saprospiraceae bacterium]HMQ83963.1 ATP-binding protein [Saprospiraceae bacterium]
MIVRAISEAINGRVGKYPVITVTGPRQSGKTTLIKSLFPDWHYFSMETPDIRLEVQENPRGLFKKYGHRMIIDEVQRTPNILSYIQTIVDEDPQAQFILSGSHNLLMLEQISQSLAGRTTLFYLLPFSLSELKNGGITRARYEDWIYEGAYPRLYDRSLQPSQFYPDYLETYVQRDVRQIRNIGNLNLFIRFLSICAGYIGQQINYNNMANATGVSVQTIQSWLSVLETSYIIYQVSPYFRNFNKRITKSTKLYFYDTGLACSLLRMNDIVAVENYFSKGALFENFVINEIIKYFFNQGLRPPIYYWRDSKGNEIDLLLDMGAQLIPFEIKSGHTLNKRFFDTIAWWEKIADVPIRKSFVVYGGEQDWETEIGQIIAWEKLSNVDSFLK